MHQRISHSGFVSFLCLSCLMWPLNVFSFHLQDAYCSQRNKSMNVILLIAWTFWINVIYICVAWFHFRDTPANVHNSSLIVPQCNCGRGMDDLCGETETVDDICSPNSIIIYMIWTQRHRQSIVFCCGTTEFMYILCNLLLRWEHKRKQKKTKQHTEYAVLHFNSYLQQWAIISEIHIP